MGPQVVKKETYDGDLSDLRAFAAVTDLGSITAAARALGETKGSVSRRIRRLEAALGVELLSRTPRKVRTTEDGLRFRQRLGRALELLDAATAEVQHQGGVPSGHLRVTAPFDLSIHVFAPIVVELRRRYPEISVDIVMTSAMLDFEKEQIDVALRATGALPDSSLIAHKLADASSALYASPDYVARQGAPKHPKELLEHPLIVVRSQRGSAQLALEHVASGKRVEHVVHAPITSSDFTFSRQVALTGGGIAVVPCLLADGDEERGLLVRILPEWVAMPAALFLVYPAARFLPAKVRVFRDLLLASFGKGPARR